MLKNATTRWTATLLIAAMSIPMLAPAAMADHGRRRWKHEGARIVRHGSYPRAHRVVIREHGNAGPLIAGLVGGFLIGNAVAGGASHRVERRIVYRYHDPYGDGWYDSVDSYWDRNRDCRHPRVLRVIDVRSGDCVRVIRYHRGDWRDDDRGWDRDWDRGCDRDGHDDDWDE